MIEALEEIRIESLILVLRTKKSKHMKMNFDDRNKIRRNWFEKRRQSATQNVPHEVCQRKFHELSVETRKVVLSCVKYKSRKKSVEPILPNRTICAFSKYIEALRNTSIYFILFKTNFGMNKKLIAKFTIRKNETKKHVFTFYRISFWLLCCFGFQFFVKKNKSFEFVDRFFNFVKNMENTEFVLNSSCLMARKFKIMIS